MHFTGCYNNYCQIHQDAKYGVGYWLKRLQSQRIKGTIKEDNKLDELYALPTDLRAIASQRSAEDILREEYLTPVAEDISEGEHFAQVAELTYNSESTAEARDLKDGIPQAQDNREKLGALEAETKTAIEETKLVVGMLTPLNTILIASQSD